MRNIIYNIGYFLKEAKTILRLNLLSNIFSLLSTGLIFFILAMVISGWWISNQVVEAIQGEAEINVYFKEDLNSDKALQLVEDIKAIKGVREARLVDKAEAYARMEEILGKEAVVMEYFEGNPFSPFIELSIHMGEIGPILEQLELMSGIEHVRDNREVLERIQGIARILSLLGYMVVTAVGVSTIVIISHNIRMGIYDSREQIHTLRLMGAPEAFIAFPFLLEGVMLTLAGGALASTLASLSIRFLYAQMSGPLPFIPLPSQEDLIANLVLLVMSLSAALGAAGSFFGLSSARNR